MGIRGAIAVATAATTAAVGLLITGPQAAADPGDCDGFEVLRCAWLVESSDSSYIVEMQAQARDTPGGGDYWVAASQLKLQRRLVGGWHTVKELDDYDGWHAQEDLAYMGGNLHYCGSGEDYRVTVAIKWRRAGTSDVFPTTHTSPIEYCGP